MQDVQGWIFVQIRGPAQTEGTIEQDNIRCPRSWCNDRFCAPDILCARYPDVEAQLPREPEAGRDRKMAPLRTCLTDAGFVEGMTDGDFVLDPIHETVDGVKTVKAFFYRFSDRILNDEDKILKIEACKNAAAR